MPSQPQPAGTTKLDVSVRPLQKNDLSAADHIMRLAFGTFLGLPEPTSFMGDAGYVRTRWQADPSAAFSARIGDELVGSNFASNWGSVGFFGPLTVRPDLWDRGVGKRLLEPVMECFEKWGTKHAGLFTFAHSQKHVCLYQKFGAVCMSPKAEQDFERLLDACEEMAAEKGLSRLDAGVNMARHEAYRRMLARGFRTELQGVAMQRRNELGYNRPGVYLIDDWR